MLKINKILKDNLKIILVVAFNILLTGLGMGVPFFNILLSLPLGYYLNKNRKEDQKTRLQRALKVAVLLSGLTLILMLIIWLPALKWLTDPTLDVANFGHPFWLYDPTTSFIGWIVLMVFVAPILQMLGLVFGGVLAILYK
jgi:hypothetical protein